MDFPEFQVNGVIFKRNGGIGRRGGVIYVAEDGTRLRSIKAVETFFQRCGLKDYLPDCLSLFNFSEATSDPTLADGDDLSSQNTPCKRDEPLEDLKEKDGETRRSKRHRSSPPPPTVSAAAAPVMTHVGRYTR